MLYKDQVLDELELAANVAQFVSFSPALELRYSRLRGYPRNYPFPSPESAIGSLLEFSPEGRVNVRSFDPRDPKGGRFDYGLASVHEALQIVKERAGFGLYTIVNETIDVRDGGVSGVVLGGILEFAPDDTPRCVDKPGTVCLPAKLGIRFLEKVYGFRPALEYPEHVRVEFSVHPVRRGYRHEHTVIWEVEQVGAIRLTAEIVWPNNFSRMIGDKAFGLLIADLLELPVPAALVVSRRIAPFSLGRPTGTREYWMRTCPPEQVPGRFPTWHGWRDPFRLLAEHDSQGTLLSSVLAQESVEPVYSGAATSSPEGRIEGVRGKGDKFMQGRQAPVSLPAEVGKVVRELFDLAREKLATAVRGEWVYDGQTAWLVQLHGGGIMSSGRTIFPGEANYYHRFETRKGIEGLRELASKIQGTGQGVILVGNVGVTSHLGDILRRAQIPSRLEPENATNAPPRGPN